MKKAKSTKARNADNPQSMESKHDLILTAYASDRRSYDIPNYMREDLGCVVRYTPLQPDGDGIVCFTNISGADLGREIKIQCDYFQNINRAFEWKVYDFDKPSFLADRLVEHEFERGDIEVLMVYDLANSPAIERKEIKGIEIRKVSSPE